MEVDKKKYMSELKGLFENGKDICEKSKDGYLHLEFSPEECEILAEIIAKAEERCEVVDNNER